MVVNQTKEAGKACHKSFDYTPLLYRALWLHVIEVLFYIQYLISGDLPFFFNFTAAMGGYVA